ncbi:MAG: hypothetical protein CMC65_05705 [Flavobacteriaceae bacterium]|nr:hypothetical protein [Flavobacteriaceae bacterium]|tara:strand:- start:460 stop:2358 length:1899 start_codon:yes stop_codon:yes gene_type:complete
MSLTPLTLSGAIQSFNGETLYGESDGLGLASQYLTYDVVIKDIQEQTHADASTRNAFKYNGLDLSAGMFISDTSGSSILRINSISAKSSGSITCVCEDVDMMSYRLQSQNSMSGEQQIKIFALNPEGEPVFAGSPFQVEALQKIASRFSLNEKDDRVRFQHASNTNLAKGEIVAIDASGNLVKYGTAGSSATKLGVVVDTYRGGKDIFIKPFNDILRKYAQPEELTGTPGGTYYTKQDGSGDITTTSGGKQVFMHLNSAIANTANITSTSQPAATDTVILNGITIFNGPNGDSVPADAAATTALFNAQTSNTNVSASITQAPGEVNAEGNTIAYAGGGGNGGAGYGDILIYTNATGAAPASGNYPEITISDGNNTGTVTFNNPNFAQFGYDAVTWDIVLQEIQTVITNSNLELVATSYTSQTHGAGMITISTTGSATGITLANVHADEFGSNIVGNAGITGLTLSASLGASTLTLTRTSGGPIELTGSPLDGGYLNQSGVVSSYGGRIPFLLMIEAEGGGGGVAETGISTRVDYNKTPSATSSDEDTTGLTITYTPFSDGAVIVKVNGLQINLGNGAKDEAAYFSADGGTTAKSVADIAAGDTLYWMGSIATYELETDDEIDIVYDASSNDV